MFLLLMISLGEQWVAVPVFATSDLLLVTTGRIRLVLASTALLAYVAVALFTMRAEALGGYFLEFGVFTGLFYAMTGLVRAARQWEAARIELARAAVGRERLRVRAICMTRWAAPSRSRC